MLLPSEMPARAHEPEPETPNLAAMVQQNQAFVWRYLRFLGCDPALADDLTQETFVAVLGRERTIDPRALRGYLRQTAGNLLRKTRGRRARHVELIDETVADRAFALFLGKRDDGNAYLTALNTCLAGMPPRIREALHWRYADKLSRRDIAHRLEMQESGVKSLLKRACAKLRECVTRRMT